MHPVHDSDVVLMQAITLASKRKPAGIAELLTAIDMVHDVLPSAAKLGDAFRRLSVAGLVVAQDEGFRLSAEAEKLMGRLPRKVSGDERLFALKELLVEFTPPAGPHESIDLDAEALSSLVQAHVAARPVAKKDVIAASKQPLSGKAVKPARRGQGFYQRNRER